MSTNVSSVVSHFPSPQNNFVTSLSSAIGAAATTVPLNSVAGYTNGQVVAFVVEPTVVGQQQTFTGTVSTGTVSITNVVWTAGTNVAHAAGAVVVDYATATHIAMMSKGILVEHTQAGLHDPTKVAMLAGTQTFSGTKTFTTMPVIPDNGIAASKLATTAITLGYAQIVANFATTSTTNVQVTGLTSTVTVPAGGRRIRVTVYAQSTTGTIGQKNTFTLWNGTVGSGTLLQSAQIDIYTATAEQPLSMLFSNVPAAGSLTLNVGMRVSGGTGTLNAGASGPAFILVEAI